MTARSKALVLALTCLAVGVAWFVWNEARTDARGGLPSRTAVTNEPAGNDSLAEAQVSAQPTALLESVSEARAASSSSVLQGRVIDEAGQVIAGARVSWTPLLEGDLLLPLNSDAVDWSAVDAATLSTVTAPDGVFRFTTDHVRKSPLGSVLWVVGPAHIAEPVLLGSDRASWPSPLVATIVGAPSIELSVIEGDGKPVLGAEIELLGLEPPDAAVADPRLKRAYRLFRRTWTTDGVHPVRTAALRGTQRAVARSGELSSRPWIGTDPFGKHVDLKLLRCFSAEGRITFTSGHGDATPMTIRYYVSDDGSKYEYVCATRVRSDLTFGPQSLPVIGASEVGFRMEGGGAIPLTKSMREPDVGEHVRVDFEALAGITMEFRVVGDEDSAPIRGALVEVQSVLSSSDTRWAEAYADESGIAKVAGCGTATVLVKATAPRYVPREDAPQDYADDAPSPAEIRLRRGGIVEGHVTHGGQPVRDFDIAFWQGSPYPPKAQEFRNREDGSFVLDTAPLGEVMLLASSADLPSGEPVPVQVPVDGRAQVDIELRSGVVGRGRVLDAVTRAPVTEAEVQLWSHAGIYFQSSRGRPHRVDADGAFEFSGFGRGDCRFTIEAPGYAMWFGQRFVDEDVDFGDILLKRYQPLDVYLIGDASADLSAWTLEATGPARIPVVAFDAQGHAHVESTASGPWTFCALGPDDRQVCVEQYLRSGDTWTCEIEIGGAAALDLEVVPQRDAALPSDSIVFVGSVDKSDRRSERYERLPASGSLSIASLPAGETNIVIYDAQWSSLAQSLERLASGPNSVRIELGAPKLKGRVIDGSGSPIADLGVSFMSAHSSRAWFAMLRSGGDGSFEVLRPPFEELDVFAYDSNHGYLVALPLRVPRGDEHVTIEFDPRAKLRARLLDGGLPLSGLRTHVRHVSDLVDNPDQYSNEHGEFEFGPVNATQFHVEVAEPGYWAWPAVVEAREGGDFVPVQVRRLGKLSVHVTSAASGASLSGAPVALHSVEFDADVATWIGEKRVPAPAHGLVTDGDGRLELAGLPRGEYRCQVAGGDALVVVVPPNGVGALEYVVP